MKGEPRSAGRSFRIITLGCRVNQYESAYFHQALSRSGWRPAERGERADAVIVNTCIVTRRAAHQSRQAIRKAIRENPEGRVAAAGCYAQVFPETLSAIPGIGLIVDNRSKAMLPRLLWDAAAEKGPVTACREFEPDTPFELLPVERFPGRSRANLKIQDGCGSFCAYCIVPFARGPCRSLPPSEVLSMMAALAGAGHREVVLTGIHLGKYGVDLGGDVRLDGLLRAVGREGLPVRVRLSSLHPDEIDDALIERVAGEPWLCPHFHISLQSGDDTVLKRMNRTYTARQFSRLVNRIHDRIPLAAIGVDIISGFPGESPAAHRQTVSLIRDLPVSYLHVFPFSVRPGTAAAAFDGRVDAETIRKRAGKLRDLGQRKRAGFYARCLGQTFPVLVEGWCGRGRKVMRGTSDNYLPVRFASMEGAVNRVVPVTVERAGKAHVWGGPPGD